MDVEVRSSSSVDIGPSYAWKKAACREHGVRLWTRGIGLCGEDRERETETEKFVRLQCLVRRRQLSRGSDAHPAIQ